MNSTSEPLVNMFLWVSHGTNISSNNIYYPIETQFNSIITYSRPFEFATTRHLEQMSSSPCRVILGTCPKIPMLNPITNKKIVLLPPLLFSLNMDDRDEIKKWSGLYYFTIKYNSNRVQDYDSLYKKYSDAANIPNITVQQLNDLVDAYYKNAISDENLKLKIETYIKAYSELNDFLQFKTNCEFEITEKILTHEKLIQAYGNNSNITYSQIFQLVLKQCKNKNIDPNNISLGIFSCQSQSDYIKDYNFNISKLIPVNANKPISAVIFDKSTIQTVSKSFYISPTIIPLTQMPTNWTALGKIRNQGCGFNVLSYYNIITQDIGRENAVCLDVRGQTIFSIIEYINVFYNKINFIPLGFLVVRKSIDEGIKFILDYLANNELGNVAIIFKMYKETEYAKNGRMRTSHVGHTVSVFKYNKQLYYADPQASLFTPINSIEFLVNYFNQNYYNTKWNFIDIIFNITNKEYNTADNNPVKATQLGIFLANPLNIIEKTPDVSYGGKKTTNKTKKNIMKNKKKVKNIKKSKKSIKKRCAKSKKYYGGNANIDTFEQTMLAIDKKYNTPTVLSLD